MPAKAKVTKEMIVDAAFAVAREAGVESINARAVSEKLNCSTQPVMYHFSTIEELKRTVYAKADSYHSEYLMNLKSPQKGVMLGIGMNYIRFAIEEPHHRNAPAASRYSDRHYGRLYPDSDKDAVEQAVGNASR